ncbi:MAG: hypothetical protein GY758_13000 [Fuerstiella sp.]|nr:hypothetical protein [Fuerstiella sp.]
MTDVVQQSMVRPKADELVALAVIPSKFSRVDRTGQEQEQEQEQVSTTIFSLITALCQWTCAVRTKIRILV